MIGHVVRAGRLRLRLWLRRLTATALRAKTLGHGGVRQLRHRPDTPYVFLRVAIEPGREKTAKGATLLDETTRLCPFLPLFLHFIFIERVGAQSDLLRYCGS